MKEADCLSMQLTLFDKCECPRVGDNHDSLFGKTYQVHLQADQSVVLTLEPCLKASQKPIFQCLKMEDGQQPEWFNAQSVKLHGEFLTLNFGEFPNEERESSLSQILQQPTDVPEKYYLSAKAVIGILKRAQKRNKELPFALKEALIQQSGMRGDYYGEKEITYAGEILRSVWSEAGTEAFVEWVRRTALLVQQKKILFADMQYDSEEEEKIKCASYESKDQQTESEGDCARSSMCGLWEDWLYRGSSCGLKSHEQLVRKLGEVMQKLSCQKTPYALFMRCLWIASEGTSSMRQALASVEEIEFERLGHAIHEENKRDFERKCEINKPLLFDVRISSDGTHNWRAHCYETEICRSLDTHAPDPDTNHGGVAILEDVNLEHQNAQVVFSFDSLSSNSMKSANPHSGCRQVEIAKCLDTTVPEPSKNQGGIAIVCKPKEVEYAITAKHYKNRNAALRDRERINVMREKTVGALLRRDYKGIGNQDLPKCDKLIIEKEQTMKVYDMTHADEVMRPVTGDKSNCLNSRMGTGGNQVPVIHDEEQYKVRRLTPIECERLQGLPDGYTDVPLNRKPASDANRYKALGNGMAQPCADYVIQRIVGEVGKT